MLHCDDKCSHHVSLQNSLNPFHTPSPCIVADDAAIDVTARRLVWGKCINSGQTCIAPDYIICSRDKQAILVERCKEAVREFYGEVCGVIVGEGEG